MADKREYRFESCFATSVWQSRRSDWRLGGLARERFDTFESGGGLTHDLLNEGKLCRVIEYLVHS